MLNRILLFSAILLLIRCSQKPEDVIVYWFKVNENFRRLN